VNVPKSFYRSPVPAMRSLLYHFIVAATLAANSVAT
jgi:hypothetical protein